MKYTIYELQWDEGNQEHIWRHRVYAWEVEDVVFDDPLQEASLVRNSRHGERLIVKGRTRTGRLLIIYLKQIDPEAGTWRCATARETKGR